MESKELSPIEELYNEYIKVKPLGLKLKIDIDYYLAKEQSRESTFKKQIEELQSQLAEKDKEIEKIKRESFLFPARLESLKYRHNKLQYKLEDKEETIQRMAIRIQEMDKEHQSELTSLKEKHKRDVIAAFLTYFNFYSKDFEIDYAYLDEAEQYYTQNHEKE